MKLHLTIITVLGVLLSDTSIASAQESRFMGQFTEDFHTWPSDYFDCNGKFTSRYVPCVPSLTEKGTDVMLMRIDPAERAGAGRGPEIGSRKLTHFGSYSARLRVPDVKDVQPNVGSVVGYFTYRMDRTFGLSEIDIEFLIADPRIIYIGAWTSTPDGQLQRIGRTINLAEGRIYETIYRSFRDGNRNHRITDEAGNSPAKVEAIKGFDASKQFYEYGFDWHADRLTWWMIHPQTNEKIILWDYHWSTPDFPGIPVSPTTYLLNFWHTNDWNVETNPKSLEAPAYPYMLEADWMPYEPYVEESEKWCADNNWK